MQDQQSTNNSSTSKKLARVNKVPSLTQQGRWTFDALKVAMDVVEKDEYI